MALLVTSESIQKLTHPWSLKSNLDVRVFDFIQLIYLKNVVNSNSTRTMPFSLID